MGINKGQNPGQQPKKSVFSTHGTIDGFQTKVSKTFANLAPEKQSKIIDTAVEEFSAKGYRGTSINTLVARLGIAKGSLFQYFGSKKGLFLFIFSHVIEQAKTRLRPVRDDAGQADLFERLEKTLLAGTAFIRKYPRYYALYLTVMFESTGPFRAEILHAFRRYSVEYLQALLKTARERGEIQQDVPIEQTAFWLDAMMDRFLQAHVTRYLDGGLGLHQADDKTVELWIESLMNTIRNGLASKGSKEIKDQHDAFLIVAACRFELDPLLRKMDQVKHRYVGGREGWQGYYMEMPIFLLVSGVGGVNASQAITAALEKEIKPALVLQTGCGGGFRSAGVKVGDVCFATYEYDVHLGLEAEQGEAATPLPFDVLPDLKVPNQFEVDGEALSNATRLKPELKRQNIGFHQGPFISVGTITTSDETAANYYNQYGAIVENMEGAATAQVCQHYRIPFLEIRGISNFVGHREREQWELEVAADHAASAILNFIEATAPQAKSIEAEV